PGDGVILEAGDGDPSRASAEHVLAALAGGFVVRLDAELAEQGGELVVVIVTVAMVGDEKQRAAAGYELAYGGNLGDGERGQVGGDEVDEEEAMSGEGLGRQRAGFDLLRS